jgi:hypothetical protein
MMKRIHQFLLIATFVLLCWLLMQAVHELGHEKEKRKRKKKKES